MSAVTQDVELGIRSRVPATEYFALPGTSFSKLNKLRRSPLHYLYGLTAEQETKPLTLGRATHCAVLEPERFASDFVAWGERTESGRLRPRNGKDWDAFEAKHATRTIITADENSLAFAMQKAVRDNAIAMRYLEIGDPEVTMQWIQGGRLFKARPDWITRSAEGRSVLTGLKSARDCRPFIFGAAAARYGYHLQWALYYDGYKTLTGKEPLMIEVVVENTPPHAVAVYRVPQDVLLQGRDEYELLVKRLEECEATGYFPGPLEDEAEITLPSWAMQSTDDLSDLGVEWQ